jgi:hypothetical protein
MTADATLDAAGFGDVSTADATGRDRAVVVAGNWRVCEQTPTAADGIATATPVTLHVAKTGETCDGQPGKESDDQAADEPAPDTEPDKYEQTWTTSYGDTTCGAWDNEMNGHQRWVAAADMLVSARKQDGGDQLPPDALIDQFVADITTACEPIDTMPITEIAGMLYLMEATYQP